MIEKVQHTFDKKELHEDFDPENEEFKNPSWVNKTERAGFNHTDDLDVVLFRGVARGYFHRDELEEAAEKIDNDHRTMGDNDLSKTWRKI